MKYRIENIINKINSSIVRGDIRLELPISRGTLDFVKVLQKEGFCRLSSNGESIIMELVLLNHQQRPVISKIALISKGSRKISGSWKQLKNLHQGCSLTIVSSSQGLITHSEAVQRKIGGVLVCNVIV